MNPADIQQIFFKHIKSILPAHLSLADELCELLDISSDSAYRRIRGEKLISLEEIAKLSAHYRISLDQLMNIQSNNVIFSGNYYDGNNFDFEKYIDYLLGSLEQIARAGEKKLYYEAKDLPLFHYFQFPELAAFKFFFWMKTALAHNAYSKSYFEDNDLIAIVQKKGGGILKAYNKIPTYEIWSIDGLNATLRQIEYYSYTGVFRSKDTIDQLYHQLGEAMEHVKEQAEAGGKFLNGGKPVPGLNNFYLYYNEWFLGNNTVWVETDGQATVYLNHAVMNQVMTRDTAFCNATKNSLDNIVKKSILLSSVGEKERNRFFNSLLHNISNSRKHTLAYPA